jgi:Tol biopolymer transport system component/DNA-binding winged helix-turn-helix (wHTH) protein
MPLPTRILIGPWLADPAANELVRDGDAVRVEPKMMEVLVVLAEHPGETVLRDDLLERVWPGVVVTDDALSGTISKLRRVLGDDARNPSFIETIPRTGYRLVAPVAPAEAPPPARPSASPAAPPQRTRRATLVAAGVGAAALLLALLLWARRGPLPEPPLVARPVTHSAGVERYPALDASGERLAFSARARDSTFYHLFVQSLTAETPTRLTDARADDLQPVWSPDGQTLAFLRCRALRCEVYTVPVLGGAPRRAAETSVSPYGLAWAPDGAAIVVDRDTTTAPYRLVRLDLATGERRPLTDPQDGALGDLAPALGPDGTVAFVRHSASGTEDLYLLPPDSTEPVRLTEEEGRIRGFAWEPNGHSLLVAMRRDGPAALWRVPTDGGPLERAALPALRDPGGLAVRADRLVVETWTVEVNLWEATGNDEGSFTTRPLVMSSAADRSPALSPDGDRLAFISDRSGTPELWVARRDGSAPLRLTDFGGAGLEAPAWLGERIAFEVQRDGMASIYTVGADGGTPQPLTDSAGYDVVPRPSRDGRWLYFGSDRSGDWQAWRVPTEGGAPEQVTSDGGFAAMESPDGRTLYFTRYFEPGLWAMPTEGGPTQLVTDRIGALDWGNWAVTDAGLFWVDREDDGARVLRMNLDTNTVAEAIDAGDVPVREVGLTATADGHSLVLAHTERVESDLVLLAPVAD